MTTLALRALSSVALCALSLLAVMVLLAVITDGALLVRGGASLAHLAGGIAAAFGLAICAAMLCAVPAAILMSICLRIATARAPWRHGWPLLVFAVALVLSWTLIEPDVRVESGVYRLCAILSAIAASTALWSATSPRAVLRWLVCAPLLVGSYAMDLWLVSGWYPEMHALFHMLQVVGLLALCAPIIRRARATSRTRVVGTVIACFAVSLVLIAGVDRATPGWRWTSQLHARHAPRLAQFLRAAIDFDSDGYSPIAWGVDCDDWNAQRNPKARDRPGGGDANCNGVDPPEHPGASDFGLSPAFGNPVALPGAVDLVLLITVESLRADVLDPRLLPNLWAFSEGGIRFTRAYSGASQTKGSLGLLLEPAASKLGSIAQTLRASGVHTTAIVPNNPRASVYARNFDEEVRSENAPRTTTAVLSAIAKHSGPHFIWAHYYDSHAPFKSHPEVRLPDDRTGLPQQPAFLSELAYIDLALGTLFASLPTERTLVIVTGDHGEAFGEHGVMRHGQGGFEEIVHVAAVAHVPGVTPAVYDDVVSHRDIPPTLLGGFGLRTAAERAETFGRSWLRLRSAPQARLHEFVVTRTFQSASGSRGKSPVGVLVGRRYKLIARYEDHLVALYDLLGRGEDEDLAGSEVEVAQRLWRALALYSDLDQYP